MSDKDLIAEYLLSDRDLEGPGDRSNTLTQNLPDTNVNTQHNSYHTLDSLTNSPSFQFQGLDPKIFMLPANAPALQNLANKLGVEYYNPNTETRYMANSKSLTSSTRSHHMPPPPGIPFPTCFPLYLPPTPPRPRIPTPDPRVKNHIWLDKARDPRRSPPLMCILQCLSMSLTLSLKGTTTHAPCLIWNYYNHLPPRNVLCYPLQHLPTPPPLHLSCLHHPHLRLNLPLIHKFWLLLLVCRNPILYLT